LEAHRLWNYEECNNAASVLHKMIPREGIVNKPCIFYSKSTGLSLSEENERLRRWKEVMGTGGIQSALERAAKAEPLSVESAKKTFKAMEEMNP